MVYRAFICGSNGVAGADQLKYAAKDAESLAARLVTDPYDFDVRRPSDPADPYMIQRELDTYAETCSQTDTLVIFFSGHGWLHKGKLLLEIDGSRRGVVTSYLAALSPSAVLQFRELLRGEYRAQFDLLSDWELVESSGLTDGKCLTRAGVLLFGKDLSAHMPSAIVHCAAYNGVEKGTAREIEHVVGNVAQQIVAARDFVAKRALIGEKPSRHTAQAEPVYTYPMVAVRELIANAIAHRDYEDQTRNVHVTLFSDRLEISSPGGWYPDPLQEGVVQPLSNLKTNRSIKRNIRIAHQLSRIRLMEAEGSGIPAALFDCENGGWPPPQVEQAESFVTVILRPREFRNRGDRIGSVSASSIWSDIRDAEHSGPIFVVPPLPGETVDRNAITKRMVQMLTRHNNIGDGETDATTVGIATALRGAGAVSY